MIDAATDRLIERYLSGALTAPERRAFEQRLATEPALARALRLHRELAATLGDPGAHALRDVLQQTDATWTAPRAGGGLRVVVYRSLAAAAAVLLLLTAVWWLWPAPDGPALYAAYYTPFELPVAERSAGTTAPLLQRADAAYRAADYEEALQLLTQLTETVPDNTLYRFYLAQAALRTPRTEVAVAELERLLDTPDHLFVQQSRWYLALAYLKTERREAARETLRAIEPGAYRYREAQQLLRRL